MVGCITFCDYLEAQNNGVVWALLIMSFFYQLQFGVDAHLHQGLVHQMGHA